MTFGGWLIYILASLGVGLFMRVDKNRKFLTWTVASALFNPVLVGIIGLCCSSEGDEPPFVWPWRKL